MAFTSGTVGAWGWQPAAPVEEPEEVPSGGPREHSQLDRGAQRLGPDQSALSSEALRGGARLRPAPSGSPATTRTLMSTQCGPTPATQGRPRRQKPPSWGLFPLQAGAPLLTLYAVGMGLRARPGGLLSWAAAHAKRHLSRAPGSKGQTRPARGSRERLPRGHNPAQLRHSACTSADPLSLCCPPWRPTSRPRAGPLTALSKPAGALCERGHAGPGTAGSHQGNTCSLALGKVRPC